jgi:hypothetical protein
MWQNGENKMQRIMTFLRSEQASSNESDGLAQAASAVQFHTEREIEWSESSDDEPETGSRDVELEPMKEEATVVCSTSKTKAPKLKYKKKPKKSKRKGRK